MEEPGKSVIALVVVTVPHYGINVHEEVIMKPAGNTVKAKLWFLQIFGLLNR